MTNQFVNLFLVAGMAVLAGVAGFVIGGVIEIRRHHKKFEEHMRGGKNVSKQD